MAVKRSQSAARVLLVLEKIARHQPVGVSELSRVIDEDKSAVQRAIMTLADEGWIQPAPGEVTRWELSGHIHVIAQMGRGGNDLRRRSRAALEMLRDETGETVLLNVPDARGFVIIEVLESRQMLRTAPMVGMMAPVRDSATGRALLPYMSRDRQVELLGEPPSRAMLEDFAATRARGWSVNDGDIAIGSTNIGAPIFEADGRPIGAVVVSGPSERLTPEHQVRVGPMVARTARNLSHGAPPGEVLSL